MTIKGVEPRYIVVAKNDDGVYELMTRTTWVSEAAAQRYSQAIAFRAPIVVLCERGVDFRPSEAMNTDLPPMDPRERADLEHEAGHPFVSDRQAYEYLKRRTHEGAVSDMLDRENPEHWEPSENDIINWNEANDYTNEGQEEEN